MRLSEFIAGHTESIVVAWEAFARQILPAAKMGSLALRDHAEDILRATVRDMTSAETAEQRLDKLSGYPNGSPENIRLNGASEGHAIGRLSSGFNLLQLVSEYRALRISVLSLWRKSHPQAHDQDVDDLNLFHDSIDHSLATAASSYTRRVEEARNMFLAILSHDLRSPLNAIAMSAQLLPQAGTLDPESTGFASTISTSAEVMTRMISDLLDYTRTRLGAGMPVSPVAMDLGVVCQEVVDEARAANPTAKLHLVSTGDVTGEWDAARMRQVVSNLLGNAIQHGDRSSTIELILEGDQAGVTLAIRNQGQPIPPGEMTKIFDPLVRGASAGTPKQNRPGSIGLGLYIARELVHAHLGTIDVTSSAEAGTAFTIHLPHHPPVHVPENHPGASLSDDNTATEPTAYRETVKPDFKI